MRRIVGNTLFFLALGVFVYIYRIPISTSLERLYAQYFPCKRPVTYSIGSIDPRFGISREEFLKVLLEAEAIWEEPSARELFSYVSNGKLTINLMYDYRQEATDKMRSLGLSVDDNQASYNALTARLKLMKKEFEKQMALYEAGISSLEQRNTVYNTEVATWNRKGGAPKDVFERLQKESTSLKNEMMRIRSVQDELQKRQRDINSLVTVINQVASNINAKAEEFNKIGRARGEEFTEGRYTIDRTGQKIDIYQFTDSQKLKRVLAHEFGHALSLEHVEDPKAIMYRLNQGINTKLSESDMSILEKLCGTN